MKLKEKKIAFMLGEMNEREIIIIMIVVNCSLTVFT